MKKFLFRMINHISWDDFCHHFYIFRNFFNDPSCNDILKNELNDYFNPVLGSGSFDDPYNSACWSPDGTMLVSIVFGEEAQLWYVGPVPMWELLLILKAKTMDDKSKFQQDEFLKEIWDSLPAYIRYKLQTQKPPMKKRKTD